MMRRVVHYMAVCTRCDTALSGADGAPKLFGSEVEAAHMAEALGWRSQVGIWWCRACIDPVTGDPLEPISGPVGESAPQNPTARRCTGAQ